MGIMNINECKTRPMEASDWEDVSRIYLEGINTNLATFQTDCPDYDIWDNGHLHVCRMVICDEGRIAGWTALSPISSVKAYAGVAELSIYIDDNYKSMGLGERLLGYLIECSESNNIWTLYSSIMENNLSSVRLHEKCGFRKIGYREKVACDSFGNWRNTVLYERRSKSLKFK